MHGCKRPSVKNVLKGEEEEHSGFSSIKNKNHSNGIQGNLAAAATLYCFADASGSEKIPGITTVLDTVMMNVSGMDVNDDGWMEDLIVEIHEDSESSEEDGMLWPVF